MAASANFRISKEAAGRKISSDEEFAGFASETESQFKPYEDNSTTDSSDYEWPGGNEQFCNLKRLETSLLTSRRLQKNTNAVSDKTEKGEKNCFTVQRKPTRRPNPDTFNRNALMARENRRKKKEYVTSLENEIEIRKAEMKKLRKQVKLQSKMIEKLQNEKSYFRNILANKTDILQLIKAIKNAKLPMNSSEMNLCTGTSQDSGIGSIGGSYYATAESSLYNYEENEFFSMNRLDAEAEYFDRHMPLEALFDNEEQNVLDLLDVQSSISDEHNYSDNRTNSKSGIINSGICLHVAGGKVSVEFCQTCNENAENAWLEEF